MGRPADRRGRSVSPCPICGGVPCCEFRIGAARAVTEEAARLLVDNARLRREIGEAFKQFEERDARIAELEAKQQENK